MTTDTAAISSPSARSSFWNRQLDHYPSGRTRFLCLGIVVLATIVLYYQFYLAGAVATHIIAEYHMSFVYYVNISVVGYILGAGASFATGAADRYGRVNIITVGLFVVGLLCLLGIPLVHSKLGFGIVFVLIGVVEGIILVATPALIRDFSPQLGRASAMGFWTLGPVLGSLVVSIQVSNTSDSTAWQDHYIAAGIVGIVVAGLSAAFLRELAPNLRDQLMVTARDRALIEARAKGIDVEASLKSPFRQMLKPDIVLSAFAISVFLIIYYTAVGFFPVYFQTIFGFTQKDANGLGNWNWTFNALALLLVGFLSDKVRVRKPFMIVGALGAIVMTVVFLTRATQPHTGYYTFVVIVSLLAVSLGVAYAPWMASFTETVERRNPALTATGLAVWGLVIRIVIAVSVFIVPLMVTSVTTLVDRGGAVQTALDDPALTADQRAAVQAVAADPSIVTKVQTLAAKYKAQLATAAAIDPATKEALAKNPADPQAGAKAVGEIVAELHVSQQQAVAQLKALGAVPKTDLAFLTKYGTPLQDPKVQSDLKFLAANGPAVQKAAAESPKQWQHYFWVAVGGEIVFIPLIFLMAGYWSSARARRAEQEHERWVEEELAKL